MKSRNSNGNIFPVGPGWKTLAAFAAVLAGALICFARISPVAQGTVWAEDGAVFIHDALRRPGPLDIFAPYQGYLHVVPRMTVSLVVLLFPIDSFAVAISFLSCLVIALIALMVFHCSRALT